VWSQEPLVKGGCAVGKKACEHWISAYFSPGAGRGTNGRMERRRIQGNRVSRGTVLANVWQPVSSWKYEDFRVKFLFWIEKQDDEGQHDYNVVSYFLNSVCLNPNPSLRTAVFMQWCPANCCPFREFPY
jgi:hypothetical protein